MFYQPVLAILGVVCLPPVDSRFERMTSAVGRTNSAPTVFVSLTSLSI